MDGREKSEESRTRIFGGGAAKRDCLRLIGRYLDQRFSPSQGDFAAAKPSPQWKEKGREEILLHGGEGRDLLGAGESRDLSFVQGREGNSFVKGWEEPLLRRGLGGTSPLRRG